MPLASMEQEYWMMYFDGSQMKSGARAGLIFIFPLGMRMRYMIRIHFLASNNVAEYEALANGLHIATELGIRWLDARGDLQLIIDQVMKESSYHDPKMAVYCRMVHLLEDKFDGLELNHIKRRSNEAADELAKLASCHTRFSKEQNQANHICAQEVHTYVRMKKYQKQCYYITYT
jgi:ribonuclease HI